MQIPSLSCAQAHPHVQIQLLSSVSVLQVLCPGPPTSAKRTGVLSNISCHVCSTISRELSRVTKLPFAWFCSLSYRTHSKLHPFDYKPSLPFCKNLLRRYIYLQFKPTLTINEIVAAWHSKKKVRNCKFYRVLVLSLVPVSVSFLSHVVT